MGEQQLIEFMTAKTEISNFIVVAFAVFAGVTFAAYKLWRKRCEAAREELEMKQRVVNTLREEIQQFKYWNKIHAEDIKLIEHRDYIKGLIEGNKIQNEVVRRYARMSVAWMDRIISGELNPEDKPKPQGLIVKDPDRPTTQNEFPLADLLDLGYVQESNRLFFHPLGLALCVELNEGKYRLFVIDARSELEGVAFDGDFSNDPDAINRVFMRYKRGKRKPEELFSEARGRA